MLNMKRLFPLMLTALVVCACERTADEPAELTAQQANADINKFFERVFEREIAESPVTQSRLGRVTDRLGEWDDVSDEAFAARVRRARQDLEWLQSEFDPASLNETDATSYELFVFNVDRLVAQSEFRRHEYVVDQFNGQLGF